MEGWTNVIKFFLLQEIKCKHIQVGDIVCVRNNHDIPCDLVPLISSQHDNKCYVTTANLDGETNLKVSNIFTNFVNLFL